MSKFGVGQPVRRKEDQRLITGQGRYTADIRFEGQAAIAVVRSPYAHARINGIDTAAAAGHPGVLGVFTAADLNASIPCQIPLENRDGSPRADPAHPVLCRDKARYAGDPVAFVVAETAAAAHEAVELVEVDFEPLPAVADTAKATEAGQPLVHDDVAGNLAFDWHHGDADAVEAAFAKAAHVSRVDLVNNRIICNAMEPRAAVAEPVDGGVALHTCSQGVWPFKEVLVDHLKLPEDKVEVYTHDVGGGFGMKAMFYAEYSMCAFAALKLGRSVGWTSERGEAFLSDSMGRDHVTTAELALDDDHRILALRVKTTAAMGAYYYFFAPFIPTGAALKVLPGVYDIPVMTYDVEGVFTHTVPVDAYRGAGRPESIYCIERVIDATARDLGLDPAELRRKNFIRPEQMPYKTAAGETYDVGEFARVMDACMAKADYAGMARRKDEAGRRGKRRGIGMCYYIESTMGDPNEHAGVRFADDGVEILVGTQTNGQGHETAYAQVLHARLNVPFEKIRVVQGNTRRIPTGGGTGGSRSLTAQGVAIHGVADKVIEKGKAYAAQHFEAAVADVAFKDGTFGVVGTDRRIDIMELAARAPDLDVPDMEGGLDADAKIELAAWTFPNGCHIAEIEIDPDTGVTEIVSYNIVDDFGVVVNPLLVEGQVHGGVAQGIGQALFENTVYDASGQLLTGTFMDYALPRAWDMPSFDFSTIEVPCATNMMGVKGCGEAGSVGAPAAIINAIVDSLGDLGVRHVDMPATPLKLWTLMHGGAAKAA